MYNSSSVPEGKLRDQLIGVHYALKIDVFKGIQVISKFHHDFIGVK